MRVRDVADREDVQVGGTQSGPVVTPPGRAAAPLAGPVRRSVPHRRRRPPRRRERRAVVERTSQPSARRSSALTRVAGAPGDAVLGQPLADPLPGFGAEPGGVRMIIAVHQGHLESPAGQAGGGLAADEAGADHRHPGPVWPPSVRSRSPLSRSRTKINSGWSPPGMSSGLWPGSGGQHQIAVPDLRAVGDRDVPTTRIQVGHPGRQAQFDVVLGVPVLSTSQSSSRSDSPRR